MMIIENESIKEQIKNIEVAIETIDKEIFLLTAKNQNEEAKLNELKTLRSQDPVTYDNQIYVIEKSAVEMSLRLSAMKSTVKYLTEQKEFYNSAIVGEAELED